MTESEWLDGTKPTPMLEFLRRKTSDRKLRLFACACCRQIMFWLTDEACRRALEVAERHADNLATKSELRFVRKKSRAAKGGNSLEKRANDAGLSSSFKSSFGSAYNNHLNTIFVQANYPSAAREFEKFIRDREHAFQANCNLLREIFGNPFRPVSLNPSWLTPIVTTLAQSAYDERIMPSGELDPERLGVLSDALEEAGCDNMDILNHLRSPGPHVRGCWSVDLTLRKE